MKQKFKVGFWYFTDLRTETEVETFTYEQALSAAMLTTNGINGDWPRGIGFRITIDVV